MRMIDTIISSDTDIVMYAAHVFPQILEPMDPVMINHRDLMFDSGKKPLRLEEYYLLFSAN